MITRNLIWAAFGRNAAKQIEMGLNCSRAQAWRIVSFGHIPKHFEGPFLELIDRAIAERRQELAAAEEVLRNANYRRAVRTVDSLACAAVDQGPARAAGSD